VDNLNTTAGIVAVASGAVAVVGICWSIGLTVALRKLKAAQRAVLGDSARDLVAHAAHLQSSYESLAQYVEDFGTRLDRRMDHAETRLDGVVAHRSLVRYDAYGEMSGRQSHSIALLDATRSGVVLSSIHHRDTARLYAKQINNGQPELELSPEESEAVRLAVQGAPAALRSPAAPAAGGQGAAGEPPSATAS
jgi:hypothetical protein